MNILRYKLEGCGKNWKSRKKKTRFWPRRKGTITMEKRGSLNIPWALYITHTFIGTGEWSNMTYNRVTRHRWFPIIRPGIQVILPPLERIKGISNEVEALLATLRLRRIVSAPAYDSHCVAAINMLIKRQRGVG